MTCQIGQEEEEPTGAVKPLEIGCYLYMAEFEETAALLPSPDHNLMQGQSQKPSVRWKTRAPILLTCMPVMHTEHHHPKRTLLLAHPL